MNYGIYDKDSLSPEDKIKYESLMNPPKRGDALKLTIPAITKWIADMKFIFKNNISDVGFEPVTSI